MPSKTFLEFSVTRILEMGFDRGRSVVLATHILVSENIAFEATISDSKTIDTANFDFKNLIKRRVL